MHSDNDHKPHRGRPHSPARRWPRGRSIFTAAVLAATLGVSACGSSGTPTTSRSPTILNTKKVEQAIQHSALAQRGEHAQVSCPSDVHQAKGLIFTCTAVVGRTNTQFVVTELNGSGDVHYAGQ